MGHAGASGCRGLRRGAAPPAAFDVDAEFEGSRFAVIHLMVAGRLKSGSKKRASIHLVDGEIALKALDPGGIEPLSMDNETDYCPRCQTEGRLLADRALSRLLHDDWPRSIDELG